MVLREPGEPVGGVGAFHPEGGGARLFRRAFETRSSDDEL